MFCYALIAVVFFIIGYYSRFVHFRSGCQSVCTLYKWALSSGICQCLYHNCVHQLWRWCHHHSTEEGRSGGSTRQTSNSVLRGRTSWSACNWLLARKNQIVARWCGVQKDFCSSSCYQKAVYPVLFDDAAMVIRTSEWKISTRFI